MSVHEILNWVHAILLFWKSILLLKSVALLGLVRHKIGIFISDHEIVDFFIGWHIITFCSLVGSSSGALAFLVSSFEKLIEVNWF